LQAKVAIILLTINQKNKTLECLRSLSKINYHNKEILVFDNGSTDKTIEAINEEFPGVKTYYSAVNLGVASGRNKAAEIALDLINPDYFLFLDNDVTVEKEFLEKLIIPFAEDDNVAVTTSKIKCNDNSGLIFSAGGCKINFWLGKTSPRGSKKRDTEKYNKPIDCISNGGCMMVKKSVFYELNGFDPIFNPYGPEDLDFSLRVISKSYRVRYVPEAVIYHEPQPSRSSSGGKITNEYMKQKSKNWFIFLLRHASLPQKIFFLLFFAPLKFSWFCLVEMLKGNLKLPISVLQGFLKFNRTKFSNK